MFIESTSSLRGRASAVAQAACGLPNGASLPASALANDARITFHAYVKRLVFTTNGVDSGRRTRKTIAVQCFRSADRIPIRTSAGRSEVNFFLYESVEFTGKELLEGGLRVGYDWNGGKYEVALFARNVTDEEVAVGAIDFNNLTGFINEPRIVGVQLKASY